MDLKHPKIRKNVCVRFNGLYLFILRCIFLSSQFIKSQKTSIVQKQERGSKNKPKRKKRLDSS